MMKLFTPYKIGNVEIPNRLVMCPANVALAYEDRLTNEKHFALYEERAKNGVGLIIPACYNFMDDLCGFSLPAGASLTVPGGPERVKMLIDRVHKHGSRISIQLLHPGRQGDSGLNGGQQPVAPSAEKETDWLEMPRELTVDEIHEIVKKTGEAAKLLYSLGADGVEIHGGHGYLGYSFMAERANHRTDEYGGSFENRMRFLKEMMEAINAVKPENGFLSVRYNAYDWMEDGIQVEDGVKIGQYLEQCGADVLNVTCGNYTTMNAITETDNIEEGDRTFFVQEVTKAVNIPVIAVNNIKRPETAEKLLQDGVSDFVGMARGLFADPEFLTKIKAGKPETIHNCLNCLYCLQNAGAGKEVRCAVNPRHGRESIYNDETMRKDGNGRKVVVIGGGVGGMEAAIVAAKRGFNVTLLEKDGELGGTMQHLAAVGIGKDKFLRSAKSFAYEMEEYDNIEVRLNTPVTSAEQILSMEPYAVIVATGAVPFTPPIPGVDKSHVLSAHDVLREKPEVRGKKVAIIGSGMAGLQVAEQFFDKDNKITVYEMVNEIAPGANPSNKGALIGLLMDQGSEFKTCHKLMSIGDGTLEFEDLAAGTRVTEEADVVVMSLGVRPRNEVREMMEGKVENLRFVGDCTGTGLIPEATWSGFEAAWNI